MNYTFPIDRVRALMRHTLEAKEHQALYEQPETAVPGLQFVGDNGIYLMSNGRPALKDEAKPQVQIFGEPTGMVGHPNYICYARECNPETMGFDDWWATKQRGWGGDDGVEFINLAHFEPPITIQNLDRLHSFTIAMTPDAFEIELSWTPEPAPRGQRAVGPKPPGRAALR